MRRACRLVAFLELVSLGMDFLSCAVPGAAPELSVRFPSLPPAWRTALGECEWSLRWNGVGGELRRFDGARSGITVELDPDEATAILAYPYWPSLGVPVGVARPAGAIYPFDGTEGELVLDWRGGPPAVFFRELSGAGGRNKTLPEFFDWPRFRELLYGDALAQEVSADPWTVDWRLVAEKTRSSGFDRRRLVPRPTESIELTVPGSGPWVPASPFAAAPDWRAGDRRTITASAEVDAYLCASGVLRYSKDAVAWLPRP